MPQIGNRHFPYTRTGMRDAQMAAMQRRVRPDLPAKAAPQARVAVSKPITAMPVGKPVKLDETRKFPLPEVATIKKRIMKP